MQDVIGELLFWGTFWFFNFFKADYRPPIPPESEPELEQPTSVLALLPEYFAGYLNILNAIIRECL